MSKLQELKDDIDRLTVDIENWNSPGVLKRMSTDDRQWTAALVSVLDASRRIANLDINAAAKAVSIYVHGYELPPDGMRLLEKQLSVGVNAALGITTEDDDE